MTAAELIAKVQCKLFGHKRGKRVTASPDGLIDPAALQHQTYRCPRCKVRWTRKIRKAKA